MPVAQDDPRLQRAGFARLVGHNLDYTMRKYEITLGRRSKSTDLDVVLGDMMSVSRRHAKIYYNFDTKRFELELLGKNGVSVNGEAHEPGCDPVPLSSQAYVQIGADVAFYFLLPKDPAALFRSTRKRKRASPPAALAPRGAPTSGPAPSARVPAAPAAPAALAPAAPGAAVLAPAPPAPAPSPPPASVLSQATQLMQLAQQQQQQQQQQQHQQQAAVQALAQAMLNPQVSPGGPHQLHQLQQLQQLLAAQQQQQQQQQQQALIQQQLAAMGGVGAAQGLSPQQQLQLQVLLQQQLQQRPGQQ